MNNNEYGYYTSGVKIFVGGDSKSVWNSRIEAIKEWMSTRKENHPKYGGQFVIGLSDDHDSKNYVGYIKNIDFDTMRADIWFNKEVSELLVSAGSAARITFKITQDPHTEEVLFCGEPRIRDFSGI